MGCAFDQTDQAAVKLLTTDISEGGILRWSKEGLDLARKCPHDDTLREKQLHIVSYMFEISWIRQLCHGIHTMSGAFTPVQADAIWCVWHEQSSVRYM